VNPFAERSERFPVIWLKASLDPVELVSDLSYRLSGQREQIPLARSGLMKLVHA